MNVPRISARAGLVLVALVFVGPARAQADAMAMASAESFLTITGFEDAAGDPIAKPDAVVIEGDATVFTDDTFEEGSAVATTGALAELLPAGADPLDLDAGDELHRSASVAATAMPVGLADAIVATDGLLSLFNFSETETFVVTLELTYTLSAEATADSPPLDLAFAAAGVDLLDSGADVLLFEDFVFSDTTLGGGAFASSGTEAFAITLEPDAAVFLDSITDAVAIADSIIPEPGTLVLTALGGLGLLGATVARRRRGALS